MSYAEDKDRASLTKEQRISQLEARVDHYSVQSEENARAIDALSNMLHNSEGEALGRKYAPHGDVLTGLQRDASDETFYDAVMGLEVRLRAMSKSLASVLVRCDDLVMQGRIRALMVELDGILIDWPAAC